MLDFIDCVFFSKCETAESRVNNQGLQKKNLNSLPVKQTPNCPSLSGQKALNLKPFSVVIRTRNLHYKSIFFLTLKELTEENEPCGLFGCSRHAVFQTPLDQCEGWGGASVLIVLVED